jgi:hypothetical protein
VQNLLADVRIDEGNQKLLPKRSTLKTSPAINPNLSAALACRLAIFRESSPKTNASANYSADYRRALIVMGGLPPVKLPTPRRLPQLERQNTARARGATTTSTTKNFFGAVIPKRTAKSWKKIWESLIQWGEFLANENRIDRDPGTLHL